MIVLHEDKFYWSVLNVSEKFYKTHKYYPPILFDARKRQQMQNLLNNKKFARFRKE